ncbi:MAG: hypothetical protein U0992_17450 [Planctomycetaceae bacterium]
MKIFAAHGAQTRDRATPEESLEAKPEGEGEKPAETAKPPGDGEPLPPNVAAPPKTET